MMVRLDISLYFVFFMYYYFTEIVSYGIMFSRNDIFSVVREDYSSAKETFSIENYRLLATFSTMTGMIQVLKL